MNAPPAAYTLRGVEIANRVYLHGTGPLAISTRGTAALIALQLAETPSVEQGIERAQRTYIPAERTVDKHGKDDRQHQKEHLPPESEAQSRPKTFVCRDERYAALQRPRRTDPFAEPGRAQLERVNREHGQCQYEDQEHPVLKQPKWAINLL